MEIRRLTGPEAPDSLAVPGRIVGPEGSRPVLWTVAEEAPLAILLNGTDFAVMLGTPADLEDFAVGFAVTEGIADRVGEIGGLRIAEAGDGYVLNLIVDPARAEAVAGRRRSLAGRAGCGLCGAQTLAAALPPPRRVSGRAPAAEALARAFAAFPAAQPMRAANRSTHAAAFCAPDGTILQVREDIGRHNALDKLGGALLRAGEDPRAGFLLLSSRLSVELVQKAAALGLPFVASVSAPSALALRTAARSGMGVAALAGDGVMVFDRARLREDAA